MKYDFTSIIDRKGKDALAVDNLPNGFGIVDEVHVRDGLDCIPMWIADMNFATVPTVTEALIERAKHPTYGYFNIRDEYYDSIIKWHRDRKELRILQKKRLVMKTEFSEVWQVPFTYSVPKETIFWFTLPHTSDLPGY